MPNEASNRPNWRVFMDFNPLYEGEKRLLNDAITGVPCNLQKGLPPESESRPEDQQYFIRARFIRFLALGGDAEHPVHEKGVQLEGAWVGCDPNDSKDGLNIDLESCTEVLPLFLRHCRIFGDIVLRDASTRTVNLQGSKVAGGIEARRAFIRGSLYLRDDFEAEGGMDLVDATILGSLECHDAKFGTRKFKQLKEKGTAIFASRVKISGGVFLHQTFAADGPIVFRDAGVGGNFECSGGHFNKVKTPSETPYEERAKRAIDCHGIRIGGSVYFRQHENERDFAKKNFYADGEVCFIDSKISGSFECHGASMQNPGGIALICSRATVGGTVFLHEGFESRGDVIFRRARIGGNFECSGWEFNGDVNDTTQKMVAIDCQGAKIGGSVYFRKYKNTHKDIHEEKCVNARGEICFVDAVVAGSFECHGASIYNRGRDALSCSRINVAGSVFLLDGFNTEGVVSFRRADIGGNFDASYSLFSNKGGKALSCEDIHITGAAYLGLKTASTHDNKNLHVNKEAHFVAHGEVDFSGAQIKGDFDCEGGQFINPTQRATEEPNLCANALNLRRADIAGALQLGKTNSIERPVILGSLDLRGAKVSVLIDDKDSWPPERVQSDYYPESYSSISYRKLCSSSNSCLCSYIYLDGFSYEFFGGKSPLKATERKVWLFRQPKDDTGCNFKSQPFEQLVEVLRKMGHSKTARSICVLREDSQKEQLLLLKPIKVLWKLIGYGYQWHHMLYFAIFYWIVCGIFYSVLYDAGFIRLRGESMDRIAFTQCSEAESILFGRKKAGDEDASKNIGYYQGIMRNDCPQFHSAKFSADAMLPIIGIGERRYWRFKAPDEMETIKIRIYNLFNVASPWSFTDLLDLFYTLQVLFGWLFGISLGVVLSQKVNRE
ncbi:MAG: hypothetical protein ACLPX9_16915 [Rhodomicrobium sp.]